MEEEEGTMTFEEVLIDSARYGEIEDVQAALSAGVNVDAADEQGRTGRQGAGVVPLLNQLSCPWHQSKSTGWIPVLFCSA